MSSQIQSFDQDLFSSIPIAPLGIIAMNGAKELGEKVNHYLLQWHERHESRGDALYTFPGYEHDGSFLLEVNCPRFGNGEAKALLKESVRGYDLYIIMDMSNYGVTYKMYGQTVPMSPDDHYADLKRVIGACAGKARRINVIMPMLYGGRQHKRSSRESLDCAMMLQELHAMGVSNIITFDAHDPRVANAIPMGGFETVRPSYQMLKALLHNVKDLQLDAEHMMVISPDEGALDRNIYFATVMGLDMGMFYKRRDYTRVVNGRNPIVAHEYLGVSMEGKDIFIADDMIASGDSMIEVARHAKDHGAHRVYVGATFGLFTSGLDVFEKAYQEGIISGVISTNLNYRPAELLDKPWYFEADMSKYISYLIASLNYDRSISRLLNPLSRIQTLLDKYRAEQQSSEQMEMF